MKAVKEPGWRDASAERGYAWFRAHREEDYLAEALGMLVAR
ncbi:MAG: hypothetical protein OWU33_10085 [Firmicutes bacterium]|nr:hypothetical protein [Bacillota bacterium]